MIAALDGAGIIDNNTTTGGNEPAIARESPRQGVLVQDIILPAVVAAITQPGAATKLIETVQSGVGVLSRPLINILTAHGDGKARLVRSGYEHAEKKQRLLQKAELEDLKKELAARHATPESTAEIVVNWEPDAAQEAAAARNMLTQQERKRLANIITITAEAADHLPPSASDEPVDPDWVARFFSYAQDVSAEQLQALWGRLLAGEVAKPGATSLRTLEILRTLSRSEAEAFDRVCGMLSDFAYPEDAQKISEGELALLIEAGLLDPAAHTVAWQPPDANPRQPGDGGILFDGGLAIRLKTTNRLNFLTAYAVAPSGIQIARLLQRPPSRGDVEALAAQINAKYRGEIVASVIVLP